MWARVLHIARQYGKDDERAKIYWKEFAATVEKLASDHGQVLSFAPSPTPDLLPSNPEAAIVLPSPESSGSSTASPTSGAFVEHDFKFLQVGSDVWTALQVGTVKAGMG